MLKKSAFILLRNENNIEKDGDGMDKKWSSRMPRAIEAILQHIGILYLLAIL